MELLKFKADWCGPCKVIQPALDRLSAETGIPIKVIDIEEDPEAAAEYKVAAIPTVVLVDDHGMEISRHIGAQPLAQIRDSLAL